MFISAVLAAASDNVSLAQSVGFTAFALTGFGLMWKSWRKELKRVSFNLAKKERQSAILLNALTRNGVSIPEEYYVLDQAEKEEELL